MANRILTIMRCRKARIRLTALAALVLVGGLAWWAGDARVRTADVDWRDAQLRQAASIVQTLNPDLARRLTFTSADGESPAAGIIRDQLIECGRRIPNRGIFTVALRSGQLRFGPETYPKDDPLASEPGTVYRSPPPELLAVFETRRPVVAGPYTDEFGQFVTALAPLLDRRTGEVLLVVGLDTEADQWQAGIDAARLAALLPALVVGLILLAGAVAARRCSRLPLAIALRLRVWVIAPVGLVMLSGLAWFLWQHHRRVGDETRSDMQRLARRVEAEWGRYQQAEEQTLRAQLDRIATDAALARAWDERDRDRLQALAVPLLDELDRDYGVTHLYFVDADLTCFLRAHQPLPRGDRIDRFTMRTAQRTGADCWGVELGRLGTFTLRYVRPIVRGGRTRGYLELGKEIEGLVRDLSLGLGMDVVTVVRKEFVTREGFESGKRTFGFAGQWEHYPDLLVAHQALSDLPAELDRRLAAGHAALSGEPFRIREGNRTLDCALIHLADVAGRDVADLIVLHDVSAQAEAARREFVLSLMLGAALCAGAVALLWSVTGRTQRQLAETIAALRKSEQQYKLIYDCVPVGIALISPKMEVLSVNRRMREWFPDLDLAQQTLCFQAFTSPPREACCTNCPTSRTLADGQLHEAVIPTPYAGGIRQVRLASRAVTDADGRITAAVEMAEDITEATLAEAALRDSESRLRAITDSAHDAIFLTNSHGQITYWNPAAVRILGHTREEALGRNLHELLAPPACLGEPQAVHPEFLRIGTDEAAGKTLELHVARKDGEEITATLSLSGVELQGQWHTVGILRDETERKRAEEELRGTAAALESANVALGQFIELAEAATRAKSEFLANMSHEIRTPMTAVLGYLDLIADSIESCGRCGAPERCGLRSMNRQHMEAIRRNGEHLLRLINDILDLSKVEAGKMEFNPVRFSPAELIGDVVSLMRVRAEEKRLALRNEATGPLPETVLADPLRLRQVLVNLVGNAIKFTDHGQVRVSAGIVPCDGRPRLQIEVADTGIGMNAEQIERLFRVFTQVDSSVTRTAGGTGLGLAISRRLVEAMGGAIDVRSTPGQGSTFTITIDPGPLDGVAMVEPDDDLGSLSAPAEPTTRANLPSLGCRLLLAEDGPDNRRLIRFILERAGAEVVSVENGQLALDAALAAREAGSPFDAVIMDMQMPVLDGYTATARLRAARYTGPIIALTAHAMDQDRQKCLDAGCDDYASKPIDRGGLLATIAHWTRAATEARQ